LVAAGTAQASAPGSKSSKVVLGSPTLLAHSKGFGTVAPRTIFQGGDPSGLITHIRWQRWGRATAIGWGMTYILKPTGGLYSQQVQVEIRASKIAWDPPDRARAYMRLDAREPSAPGGRLGGWFQWSAPREMCS
jgi:hypothetical protein